MSSSSTPYDPSLPELFSSIMRIMKSILEDNRSSTPPGAMERTKQLLDNRSSKLIYRIHRKTQYIIRILNSNYGLSIQHWSVMIDHDYAETGCLRFDDEEEEKGIYSKYKLVYPIKYGFEDIQRVANAENLETHLDQFIAQIQAEQTE